MEAGSTAARNGAMSIRRRELLRAAGLVGVGIGHRGLLEPVGGWLRSCGTTRTPQDI